MTSTTSTTGSAVGAAGSGAGVGAGVGSTSTGSQTSSTSGKGSGNGSGSSGLTFTGLTFSDGKISAPSGKGTTGNSTTGNSTSTKGVTLGSVGTGLGLDGSIGEGIGLTTGADGKSTSAIKTEPVMTVDEVYGKGNQSIVEDQGDYEAASNEKSNVETQTFGKQDEISFTPVSVTKDEGLVNNDAIQSVEGLNFQQKDKANQEVMDAKKARDEAEAEDKSDKAREQLAANESEETETETNAFKVGEEAASKEKAALDEAKKIYDDLRSQVDGKLAEFNKAAGKYAIAQADYNVAFQAVRDQTAKMNEAFDKEPDAFSCSSIITLKDGNEITTYKYSGKDANAKAANDARNKGITELSKAKSQFDAAKSQYNVAKADYNQYINSYNEAKTIFDKANEAYNNTFVSAPITEAPSYKANIEAARNEINNSKELTDEQKAEVNTVLGSVEAATKSVNAAVDALAANPNDPSAIKTYVNAVKTYNENVENALKGNPLAKTDLNKTFTKMIAKANDFNVTMPDGTKVSYAEFAAKKAVESPTLAKGLYEAKAKTLADEGHTVLAAIENAKAKMVTTWLGSKFTFADNQVRSQFNQMAKTDMRATYAVYNNVLNDPNATAEQRADAEAQISQAKSLMTASAALQASTGFLSGIGDSMSDGVYGVTNPDDLNGYQEALNTASNFAKIALGLGVTPGANKAYQNMYYIAGAKVNKSNLFNKDFDGDGFALCQEYGNNAAAGMISGVGELATGIALFFNPATASMGLNLAVDSVQTFLDGLYGVQREARKSVKYSSEIVSYLNEAKDIVSDAGTEKEKTVSTAGVTIDQVIDSAISQIENFELKSDEANNIDNWLEGSGSSTADNEKFNQSLTYDEWLKLIEADPTMQEYAKKLIAEKK